MKLRDTLVCILLLSVAESYSIMHFAPQYKPRGGLARLVEWCLAVNCVLLFTYRWVIYPTFVSPLRGIPGPGGGYPILGHGPERFSLPRGAKILTWVNSIPNDGLIRMRDFFGKDMLIATKHETLKEVLSDNSYDYEKPAASRNLLRRVLGDGLIVVEGAIHKFQRKHLLPAFQLRHIRDLYPMFWSKSCELVGTLEDTIVDSQSDPSKLEIELGEWCMRATLDIIGIAGFGRDFNSLKNPNDPLVRDYSELLEPDRKKLFFFGANLILPKWINNIFAMAPGSLNNELNRIQGNLNSFALNMVRERRAKAKTNPSSGSDILSILVNSNDFTDRELADQVLTMMAAGHETTSSALSWAMYLLATDTELQSRIRDEVRENLPPPKSTKEITAAQIDKLPLLNAACLETLRLYPTVPMTMRQAIKPTTLGGQLLPEGTKVILVPWAINRSTHFWGPTAANFNIDRWLNADGTFNKTGGSSSNYAQLTFLHGPRSCIGQGFAQSELKCLLAAVVGKFQMTLSRPAKEYYPAGLVTTKPANGMWIHLHPVQGW